MGSKFSDVTPRGRPTGILRSRSSGPRRPTNCPTPLAIWPPRWLHTERLSESLATLAQTFADTPAHFRNAIQAWSSNPLDERDNQLRSLLANAASRGVTAPTRSSACARHECGSAQLRTQSAALDRIREHLAVAEQLRGFIAENRQQLRPALDKAQRGAGYRRKPR